MILETYGLTLEMPGGVPPTQLDFELVCLRLNIERLEVGDPDDIALGADAHFINVAKILFGPHSAKPFIWTEQAKRMLFRMLREKVLTITGHARSTKTCLTSVFALILWLCEPDNSKCVVVSTEKSGAQNRIWGQVTDFFNAIPAPPGKHYASGFIVPVDPTGQMKYSRRNGIELLAGNENKERESATKLQGYHTGHIIPGRILLAIDEATAVAAGIFDAFFKNLSANPKARFIALGNFKAKETPFGRLCEPVNGWESVEPEDEYWVTKEGGCIHLDGLASPNWLAQDDVYPFLQSWQSVKRFYDLNLENTPEFWEMVRAFPAPVGIGELGVYDPAEIAMYKGDQRVQNTAWKKPPVLFAGVDPAFAQGGDNAVLVPIRCGQVQDDWFLIEALEPIHIPIDAQGGKPATYQILDYTATWCTKAGCDIQNVGFDATDPSFADAVRNDPRLGRQPFAVNFAGAGASDTIISRPGDPAGILRNNERFANRATEIWAMGLDFLRQGQLRGLVGAIHSQMTKRYWTEGIHRGGRFLQRIESKKDMKKRIKGKSPDDADAFFIGLACIIQRLRLRAGAVPLTQEEREEKRRKAMMRGLVQAPQLKGLSASRPRHTIGSMFLEGARFKSRGRVGPLPGEIKNFL